MISIGVFEEHHLVGGQGNCLVLEFRVLSDDVLIDLVDEVFLCHDMPFGVQFTEDDLTGVLADLDVIGIREHSDEILVGVHMENNYLRHLLDMFM